MAKPTQDAEPHTVRDFDKDDIEVLRMFYEFKYKTIMEAATKLTQFSVFAVTVSSLFTGLTLMKDMDFTEKWAIVACLTVIVSIFVIVGAAVMYGIIAGLSQVRETLRRVSPDLFDEIGVESYIRRGITVLSIVMAACGIGILSITFIVFRSIFAV